MPRDIWPPFDPCRLEGCTKGEALHPADSCKPRKEIERTICRVRGCQRPVEPGKQRCVLCAEKLAQRALGKTCRNCPAQATPGKRMCEPCRLKSRAIAADRYAAAVTAGICIRCPRRALDGFRECATHREYTQRRWEERKKRAISDVMVK